MYNFSNTRNRLFSSAFLDLLRKIKLRFMVLWQSWSQYVSSHHVFKSRRKRWLMQLWRCKVWIHLLVFLPVLLLHHIWFVMFQLSHSPHRRTSLFSVSHCTALQKHTGMKLGSMNFKNCQNMIKMTSLFIPTVVSSFPTNVHLKAHFNTQCPSSFDFQTFLRSCTSFSEDHFYRAWGKQIFVLVRV